MEVSRHRQSHWPGLLPAEHGDPQPSFQGAKHLVVIFDTCIPLTCQMRSTGKSPKHVSGATSTTTSCTISCWECVSMVPKLSPSLLCGHTSWLRGHFQAVVGHQTSGLGLLPRHCAPEHYGAEPQCPQLRRLTSLTTCTLPLPSAACWFLATGRGCCAPFSSSALPRQLKRFASSSIRLCSPVPQPAWPPAYSDPV